MLDDSVIDDGKEIDNVLPDGIYFDLDEELYHKLERYSASFMKKMDISNSDAWTSSWMNPEKVDMASAAMLVGKAAHTAQLEPHLFTQQFVVTPDIGDYPRALTNATEIGKQLEILNQPNRVKEEKVLPKARRLQAAGYQGPIWHIVMDDWEAERRGRKAISKAAFISIMKDAELIHKNPEVVKYIRNGASEVSILWTDPETSLKMKCRIDYLNPKAFLDIKNFNNKSQKPINECIRDTFKYDRHHIQAVFYYDAVEMIRRETEPLDIQGDHTEAEAQLIADLRDNPVPIQAAFLWLQKGGAPNMILRNPRLIFPIAGVLEQGVGAEAEALRAAYEMPVYSGIYCRAEGDILVAKRKILMCLEVFPNGEWQELDVVEDLNEEDFTPYWLNKYGV